jgi:hypothetical protein
MEQDPNEWRNLAGGATYKDAIQDLRRWLPEESAPPAPGSQHRILTYAGGQATWEGKDIAPDEPIPELK